MRQFILFLFGSLFFLNFSFAQIGKWENYTNQSDVNSITLTNDGLWAGTSGGVFFYSKQNYFKQFNLLSGLKDLIINTLEKDQSGKIWIGGKSGYISIYNPEKDELKTITTIALSNKTQKQINKLISNGDKIYVCTDFGISIIDANSLSFGDTYTKLGSFGIDSKIYNVLPLDTLWVASEKGIAVQKAGYSNYLDPNSWWNFTIVNGLPSNDVRTIIKFKDTIYVGTTNGVARLVNSNFRVVFTNIFQSKKINDLKIKGDSLLILSDNILALYFNGNLSIVKENYSMNFRNVQVENNKIFIASNDGVIETDGNQERTIYPSGPNSNFFPSIAVDEKGNVWAASGKDVVLKGFYRLSKDGWKNFTTSDFPEMGSNAIHKIKVTSDNTIWALGWGNGVIRIKNDTQMVRFSRANVNGLNGVIENPNFVVIRSLAEDSKGNIWMLNYRASDNRSLIKLSKDSTWEFFVNEVNPNLVVTEDIVIDQNDTKWILLEKAGQYQQVEGLIYFNEYGKMPSTWGLISRDKFGNTTPTSIAIDLRNEIWVGTSQGMYVIPDPTRPTERISSIYILRTQYINCIAVDQLNNKWVGTTTGVWVLSPDGSSLIAQFNTKNSPLPDDNIKSIAIDNNTGTVYIGTDYGMASYNSFSVKPREGFDKLKIYPNPFIVEESKNINLVIDGLVKNSTIKILTTSGDLVNEFLTPGGRIALWNGRDKNNNLVPTGIYFIVAYSEDGEQTTIGKVAVIKK
ncbi:MAG: hypothetical protein NUV92_04825 [Ignavibacteria bacterium]|jgi:ligand-binding sensor domain-containing protein|nr:hypothetical protein [Ignavibacteria bacterium]MDH7526826.1 hypothetical protein [Ignavibacteria bacterium]